ncbi:MAG: hypothetical protein BWY36_00671 [Candidatus Diapherotrites archaeon ADurb.Bin253]|jgi:uncharacterized protein (UPF0332 family)|nr:MAG: hypothetical protein BWY36_00671 [Candidatus Diapherotrites archaeon ADurb.Bin253]HNZ52321.1 hypothetical protein [Candidatus Pacearchaeota archaeon]HOH04397.1 hypothetical protein [Candidatus Pacearchaeota archaeon]
MVEDKHIEEAKKNAIKSINAGQIIKTKESKYVDFFVKNSLNSLNSAKALLELSVNKKAQDSFGMPNFNGFLWVINSSYYSMFYMARALLESIGVKIKTDESVHFLVFNALVYYFYSTGKLEKHFLEDFEDAQQESAQILGKEKAKEMINDYSNEKEKRSKFTYEIGEIAMKSKAETSLERAKKFNEEIRKMLSF